MRFRAMITDNIPFHLWLKRQRRALDLTQAELAQSIGCSVVTIKKWEAGVLRPSKDLAEILAGQFGIPDEERPTFVQFARAKSDSHLPIQQGGISPWHRLGSLPNNLPAPPNAFIGRSDEVAAIQGLLHRPGVRLLTLSGPPGIGKTRLSLEVAAEMLAEPDNTMIADGVYFVALASISDPDFVVTSIARTLGVRESGGHERSGGPLESLKVHLQSKKMLLLLDNFEQVTTAAPLLGEILSAAPQLKAMVTSREVLHIYGEHDFPMRPLNLPSPDEPGSFQNLIQYDAVRLFIERATSAKPDFALTGENAQIISQICIRLDGLPLAIELAASQIKALSPDEILSRLDRRVELLVGGPRDMPDRQSALRSAIDWSYDLLGGAERALFRRLSVFVGGCTLEAIEAVTGATVHRPSSTVASLLSKSLLRREETPGGESRFVMLETIREYASERLKESGDTDLIRHKHAEYYLNIAEQAAAELRGPEQATWIARLEKEHDNFRAALRNCRDSQDAETGLRLAAALWRFWHTRGYLSEGREHLVATLSIVHRPSSIVRPGNKLFQEIRAKALNGAGVFALMQGDYAGAIPLYEESLAIYQRLEDKAGMASTLNNLANVSYYQEDFDKAATMHEKTLAIYKELGDKAGVSKSLNNLAIVIRNQGDYGRAHLLLEESLQIKREVGDKEGISSVLNNLAEVVELQGKLEEARTLFEESLSLRLELGNKRGMAETMEGLANVNSLLGIAEGAASLWGAAEALREAIGTPLLSTDRDEYAREVAAARSSLHEATWSRAWAEGRSMTPEQAFAYARSKQT